MIYNFYHLILCWIVDDHMVEDTVAEEDEARENGGHGKGHTLMVSGV